MIFTQHYLACLSHASYVVGDETTGRGFGSGDSDVQRDRGRVHRDPAAASHLWRDLPTGGDLDPVGQAVDRRPARAGVQQGGQDRSATRGQLRSAFSVVGNTTK